MNNINCGGQIVFTVPGANYRIGAKEEAIVVEEPTIGISVYPNPAQNQVTVKFVEKKGSDLDLRVVAMDGREIKKMKLVGTGENQQQVLNIADLSSGTYIIHLSSAESSKSKKLVVE